MAHFNRSVNYATPQTDDNQPERAEILLQTDPAYIGRDLTTLKLTVLDSYEAKIKDVDKTINRLKRFIAVNKSFMETFEGEQLINRAQTTLILN